MNNLQPSGFHDFLRQAHHMAGFMVNPRDNVSVYFFKKMSLFLDFLSLPSIIIEPLSRGGQSLVYSSTQNCSSGLSP